MTTVFLLYHFFHPDDVISARLYSELAEGLAANQVDVIALPSIRSCHVARAVLPRRELWRGGKIYRIWRPRLKQSSNFGRLVNTLFMLLGWTWKAATLPREPPAVDTSNGAPRIFPREFMVIGTDPVFGILATIPWRLFRRDIQIIHWCHDVHPEASIVDGSLKSHSLHVKALRWLLRRAYRRCDTVVDLGDCMRELLINAGGWRPEEAHPMNRRSPVLSTITPWSLVEPNEVISADANVRCELFGAAKLTILYSGNLGRAHEYELFLQLARALRATQPNASAETETLIPLSGVDIHFCFAGRGVGFEALKGELTEEDYNVTLTGFASEQLLTKRLAAGDIHLVSLKDNWTGTVVPSKFFAALAIGRPVLFAGSPRSSIARWIQEHRIGWLLHGENLSQVASDLRRLADFPREMLELNQRCFQVYRQHFSRSVQLEKWRGLIPRSPDA